MADCCNDKACAIDALRTRQSKTLRIVLLINAVMFAVELVSGLLSRSTALMSDSLDNLGDAATYGLSLYAVARGARAKARVAMFKGMLILTAAWFVFGQVAYSFAREATPVFETMGLVSLVALAANATCLALLWKHRAEDVNMSSVWECSRNDIASNLAVFAAAGAVWATGSRWPDLAVGATLGLLFLRSAIRVTTAAALELRRAEQSPNAHGDAR
ncbi:MAG TPA: cation transporter [Burkholderiales bacterium]|nr:cation transporter [Burkholderiales bacterium]